MERLDRVSRWRVGQASLTDTWQTPCTGAARQAGHEPGGDWMAKVMVVDDAYSELKVMESILRNAGHHVVTLIDGEALEDKVSRERPDVLLLDIVLPKRNGFELLRSLKKNAQTNTMPIFLVSSKNQESDKAWGKRQGADDYLTKPFTPDQLVTAVVERPVARRACVIMLGGRPFAVDVTEAREVVVVDATTSVPGAPAELVGVM